MKTTSEHWADITAEKIIRNRGEKAEYVCASGITPSGTVHIGNFREIISVELIVRALRDTGKKVRFIYSWDDYDVFRKIPANMPRKELLETFLRKPITSTPDPFDKEESYARHNEVDVEQILPRVGIFPEYIYQTKQYQKAAYTRGIKKALAHKQDIIDILNSHRTSPLAENWWPISIFCGNCQKDTTQVQAWDGADVVSYTCESCHHSEKVDLKQSKNVKLFWRIDWPMRWEYEQVDFEPAGKEHHSSGGSFDTAREIALKVYDYTAPETFKYDFISIKGQGGKISSSLGNVLSLEDVLAIYQPEIVRYLFAGTRPNTEFAISFDLDVIKIYEDYDRCERVYFGLEEISEKKAAKQKRIYELSQVEGIPARAPYQIPIRHLCNLLQINGGEVEKVLENLGVEDPADREYVRERSLCAWNWISQYAPEDFRFSLRDRMAPPIEISEQEKKILTLFHAAIKDGLDQYDEKSLSERLYAIAQEQGYDTKELFQLFYQLLIGQEKGPRLINFIFAIGHEKIMQLIEKYVA